MPNEERQFVPITDSENDHNPHRLSPAQLKKNTTPLRVSLSEKGGKRKIPPKSRPPEFHN